MRIALREIIVLLLATFSIISGAALSAAITVIHNAFIDIDNSEILVKSILSITSLGVIVGSPLTGYIADRFGRRKLVLSSILIFSLSGSSGLFINSIYTLLFYRFILGVSVSGIMTVATTLVADYYSDEQRTKMMSYAGAFMPLSGVISVALGGILAEYNWRYPFFLYTPTFIIFILAYFSINEPIDHKDMNTNNSQFTNKRVVFLSYFFTYLIQFSFYLIPVQVPFYMRDVLQSGSSEIGYSIALLNVAGVFHAIFYPKLKKKLSHPVFILLILTYFVIGMTFLAFATTLTLFIIGLAFIGSGVGISVPILNLWLVSNISSKDRGKLLGGLTNSYYIGRFTSPIFVQKLIEIKGYAVMFQVAAISLAIILIVSIISHLKFGVLDD